MNSVADLEQTLLVLSSMVVHLKAWGVDDFRIQRSGRDITVTVVGNIPASEKQAFGISDV